MGCARSQGCDAAGTWSSGRLPSRLVALGREARGCCDEKRAICARFTRREARSNLVHAVYLRKRRPQVDGCAHRATRDAHSARFCSQHPLAPRRTAAARGRATLPGRRVHERSRLREPIFPRAVLAPSCRSVPSYRRTKKAARESQSRRRPCCVRWPLRARAAARSRAAARPAPRPYLDWSGPSTTMTSKPSEYVPSFLATLPESTPSVCATPRALAWAPGRASL